ncbi:glycosyltransferase family 2 protein [Limosilactobacillus equigenerosi]|uniref:glycosyltransferase family 2 protein n=1 Tax=Limosilactobacillus equigenerosi TaxID=417373 RepID=UPI0009E919CB|nr:glycosyltransferase family A protein [Limosilactobacillus equigenerosi]
MYKKCVDSIQCQTYQKIEIILVDDGSADETLSVARELAQNDKRIRVIHQSNQGVSVARNRLISESLGEYVVFVDPDDYVSADYVEFLYHLIARNNFQSKLSMCSLMVEYYGKNKSYDAGDGSIATWRAEDCLASMCYGELVDTCTVAKLYHRSLFDDISFPVGKKFEDMGTTYRLLDAAGTIECGFIAKYFYILRPNSITTSTYCPDKLDLLEMTDEMAAFVNDKYPNLKQATLRRQVYARFSTLNQTLNERSQAIRSVRLNLITFIKDHANQLKLDARVPKRDRLAMMLLNCGYIPYKYGWLTYLKIVKN